MNRYVNTRGAPDFDTPDFGMSDFGVSQMPATLGDFCLPGNHELRCYSVSSAVPTLTAGMTKAVQAGTIPTVCGNNLTPLLNRAVDADDWGALSGGEYQWVNHLWRALIYNDWDAPTECLRGQTPQGPFEPKTVWQRPPGDPDPPGTFPWGIVAGVAGVAGITALYWFVLRKKK